jgi:hypothetical protein
VNIVDAHDFGNRPRWHTALEFAPLVTPYA